ncbi:MULTISPECIES: hypothetical protein [unclassified Janibacter]|uniref:hypothetical protein n=1 Tax=unclassified Janibacter TaxID=2649294 RepID=UPI003D052EA7
MSSPQPPTERAADQARRCSAALASLAQARGPRCGAVTIIAIDGRSSSGKTRLADRIGPLLAAPVLHMDDLVPGWGGLAASVDLLHDGVLAPLARGVVGWHRRWDWDADRWASGPGAARVVPRAPLLVVEGCGAFARAVAPFVSASLWVDAPADLRRSRGLARDPGFAPWWDVWAAQEDAHFGADGAAERADLVLDRTILPADED